MQINGMIFNASLEQIVTELQSQLQINHIPLLQVVRDSGDDIMVACPYHKDGQERKPSMGIRKTDGLCHCFACGTTVPLQNLISHCFGDHSEIGSFGWNWLLKNFLTVSVEERKDIDLDYTRATDSANHLHLQNYVTEEELDEYRYTHPYWAKRKITDPALIELFDLGYDRKTDCITFPVRDESGRCLFVARRSTKTKYFNYPKGAEKPLYGLYELKCKARELDITYVNKNGDLQTATGELWMQEIIVCESMLDALTAWQYGKYAVALNGLGNERQFRELRNMPCRKLILATDADDAGMKARKRIRENVPNKIITEYKWDLDKAKDLNDMDLSMFLSLKETF